MTYDYIINWIMSYYIVIIAGFVLLLFLSYIIKKIMYKNRIKYALKFGKLEHVSGRILGALLFLTIICEYVKLPETIYLLLLDFIVWCLYLFGHTIEKKLYPHNFRF